jgi:hypothetical protein
LTRESGRGPICWQQEPYADRTCGASRLQPSRKSYLVLKAALGAYGALIAQRWKFIAIAELNLDSLRFSQEHVLRHLRQITSSTRDEAWRGGARPVPQTRRWSAFVVAARLYLRHGCRRHLPELPRPRRQRTAVCGSGQVPGLQSAWCGASVLGLHRRRR